MKSPARTLKTIRFLAVATIVWIALIHGVVIGWFGFTLLAGWIIVAALAVTMVGILGYLAWEYRRAPFVESSPPWRDTPQALSNFTCEPQPLSERLGSARLSGRHLAGISRDRAKPNLKRRTRPASQPAAN